MITEEMETTKSSGSFGQTSDGNLMSFDELDNFFDDFLSYKTPRLLNWNMPNLLDSDFSRVDTLDNAGIETQTVLSAVKKEDADVSVINQIISYFTAAK